MVLNCSKMCSQCVVLARHCSAGIFCCKKKINSYFEMNSISQSTQRFLTFEKLTTQWHRCPSLGSIPDQYVLVFHSVQHHIPTSKLMKKICTTHLISFHTSDTVPTWDSQASVMISLIFIWNKFKIFGNSWNWKQSRR